MLVLSESVGVVVQRESRMNRVLLSFSSLIFFASTFSLKISAVLLFAMAAYESSSSVSSCAALLVEAFSICSIFEPKCFSIKFLHCASACG